jgi:hypothetical protein
MGVILELMTLKGDMCHRSLRIYLRSTVHEWGQARNPEGTVQLYQRAEIAVRSF